MAEAGLTPSQILRSATVDAARAMRLAGIVATTRGHATRIDEIGVITRGAWADFVVLERDPLKDIRNTRSIVSVRIAGNNVSGIEPQTGATK
jgi:imidazolonepropionase-like amidohydrolase